MFGLGINELVIVAIVAILLFGKRLPEVAKSWGAQYRELRKGLSEIQSTIHQAADPYTPSSSYGQSSTQESSTSYEEEFNDYDEPTAPKFELPSSEPQAAADDTAPTTDAASSEAGDGQAVRPGAEV
jgi:sec-independent protein translocase protein TatA